MSFLVRSLPAEVDVAAQAPQEPVEPEVTIEIAWGAARQQLFLETRGRQARLLPAVANKLSAFIGTVRSETGHLQRATTDTLCTFC